MVMPQLYLRGDGDVGSVIGGDADQFTEVQHVIRATETIQILAVPTPVYTGHGRNLWHGGNGSDGMDIPTTDTDTDTNTETCHYLHMEGHDRNVCTGTRTGAYIHIYVTGNLFYLPPSDTSDRQALPTVPSPHGTQDSFVLDRLFKFAHELGIMNLQ